MYGETRANAGLTYASIVETGDLEQPRAEPAKQSAQSLETVLVCFADHNPLTGFHVGLLLVLLLSPQAERR